MNKLTVLIFAALLLTQQIALHATEVTNLSCEYLVNPLGVDVPKPRLSWKISSERRGELQTAYRILVASTAEKLARDQGDLWDSGKVVSDQSIQVEYAGPSASNLPSTFDKAPSTKLRTGQNGTGQVRAGQPMKSRLRCHWKVRIWDQAGKASAWSQPAVWIMGLLKPEDPSSPGYAEAGWSAKWIKPGVGIPGANGLTVGQPAQPPQLPQHPWLRRTFEVEAEVKDAMVYVNTPGHYELYINGQKVGKDVLAPSHANLKKRFLYNAYDVTGLLRKGKNCIALWLGPGCEILADGGQGRRVRNRFWAL